MGLMQPYVTFIEKHIKNRYLKFNNVTMLELGNQVWHEGDKQGMSGKKYFSEQGIIHTSIDLNCEHGALPYDLSKPIIKPEWENYFDVVTNLGTSEHIEPIEGQYECFKNIHAFTRITGIIIHGIPMDFAREQGYWYEHCNYYYTLMFIATLAKQNAYRILEIQMVNGLLLIAFKKTKNIPFMENINQFLNNIKIIPMTVKDENQSFRHTRATT